MNRKIVLAFGVALAAGALFARPHHGGFGGPRGGFGGPRGPMVHHAGPRMPMHRPMPHHYHHYSGWGRGGSHFWPGFVGGVIGGAVANAFVGPTVVAAPTVVTTAPVVTTPVYSQPVYASQQVWVPGAYVDQIQPNGTVVRVWQPGHYEARSVLVQ